MNVYWSHAIALQKLSNERSYKFSQGEFTTVMEKTVKIEEINSHNPSQKLLAQLRKRMLCHKATSN